MTTKQLTEEEIKKQQENDLAYAKLMHQVNWITSNLRANHKGVHNSGEVPKGTIAMARIDFPKEGGVLTFAIGRKYPMKGFAIKDTVDRLQIFKKVFIAFLKGFKISPFIFFYRKSIERSLKNFISAFSKGMEGQNLKDNRYCQAIRELRRAFDVVSTKSVFEDDIKNAVSLVLEFDDSYRYRLQWVLQKADINKLSQGGISMIKEMRNMFDILGKHEKHSTETLNKPKRDRVKNQWMSIRKLLWIILLNKNMKNFLKDFFTELNAEEVYMTVEDRSWASIKQNFDFQIEPTPEMDPVEAQKFWDLTYKAKEVTT